MEGEPDMDKVSFIDEYPHLAEKVRLRRLGQASVRQFVLPTVIELPRIHSDQPDPAS